MSCYTLVLPLAAAIEFLLIYWSAYYLRVNAFQMSLRHAHKYSFRVCEMYLKELQNIRVSFDAKIKVYFCFSCAILGGIFSKSNNSKERINIYN